MTNMLKGRTVVKGKFLRNLQKMFVAMIGAKVGATAGWTVNNGVNTAYANCPASQTAATLILPVTGIKPGNIITGFYFNGGLVSAGGAVTIDAALRKQVATSGAVPTDSLVASMTQIALSAAALISQGNSEKTGLSETVVDGASYYWLITVTTAASTSVNLLNAVVEINEAA